MIQKRSPASQELPVGAAPAPGAAAAVAAAPKA
jgi:hypothetical protein